jgi:hypothetical protein
MLPTQTNETQITTKVWIRSPHPRIAQPRLAPGRAPVGPPRLAVLSLRVFGGVAYHPAGLVDGEEHLATLDLSQRPPGIDLLHNVLVPFLHYRVGRGYDKNLGAVGIRFETEAAGL